MNDKNIEVYDNQADVLNRIQVLKDLGYEEQDMYIIASEDEDFSMLRGFTDVIIKEDDDSILDKFKSFLKGEDSIIDAFHRMGLGEGDREFYHDQVKEGKIILYANKDYGGYYEIYEDGTYGPVVTPEDPVDLSEMGDDIAALDENAELDENILADESDFLEEYDEVEVFEDGGFRTVVETEDTIDPEEKVEADVNKPVDEMDFETKKDIGLLQEEPPLEDLRRNQDINILMAEEFKRPIQ